MSDSLTQGAQWLDLTAIAELTQTNYGVLRRYAELPQIQEKFGAERQAGAKGVRWPAASLSDWRNLTEAHAAGTVTPKTVAAYLSQSTSLVPLSNRGIASIEQLGGDAISLLEEIRDALCRETPDNALLTEKQAKEQHGIPRHVFLSLRVRVGRRWYVRRMDVLRWIDAL